MLPTCHEMRFESRKCVKMRSQPGSVPDPAGAPLDPLAGFGEGRSGEGRGREGRKEGGGRKEKGYGKINPPNKNSGYGLDAIG